MEIKTTVLMSQLNSETKLEILSAIYLKGNISVNEIVQLSGKNRKNVSKQINEMICVGLLTKELTGRFHMIGFNKKCGSEVKEIMEIVIQKFINERRGSTKGEANE